MARDWTILYLLSHDFLITRLAGVFQWDQTIDCDKLPEWLIQAAEGDDDEVSVRKLCWPCGAGPRVLDEDIEMTGNTTYNPVVPNFQVTSDDDIAAGPSARSGAAEVSCSREREG